MYSPAQWNKLFDRLHGWVARYHEHLKEAADEDGADPSRAEILLWAYCTLMAMPATRLQNYQLLRERSIAGSGLADGTDALRLACYKLEGLPSAMDNQLSWLARLVRTLDEDLTAAAYGSAALATGEPSALKPEGYPCYLVPVTRQHRARDHAPAARRAILLHAVIPERIGTLAIDLHLHPDLTLDTDWTPWRYGAAIFPDHRIRTCLIGEDAFRVIDAHADHRSTAVATQVHGATIERCDVLMWPELTVPPCVRNEIAGLLAKRKFATSVRPTLVIAGSWHVGGADFVNRAPVYDGRGDWLLDYDKHNKFLYDHRLEGIVPGSSIPVILTEERLVAIGICLDFCNELDHSYRRLDCDVAAVPSMGARTTTQAHQVAAKSVQTIHDVVTFVVQQVPVVAGETPPPGEPPGYSFANPGHAGAPPPPVQQHDPFRTLAARR